MPLSSEAQSLFDHARNALPRWLTGGVNAALEWLYGYTEIFDEVRSQGQDWVDVTLIGNAVGVELDQHAADRGTSRRANESDEVLRERLRTISDQVTEAAIQKSVDTILTADEFNAIAQVKIPVDESNSDWDTVFRSLSFGGFDYTLSVIWDDTLAVPTYTETETAVGWTIEIKFPTTAPTTVADIETLVGSESTLIEVFIAGANPAYVLQDVFDEFVNYRFTISGFVNLRRDRGHMHTNGVTTSFLGRGYRMCNINRPMGYIVILPFGTTAASANAISEYLRQNGPAGFVYIVERRLTP